MKNRVRNRWWIALYRIRFRLLVTQLLLVFVPLAGLQIARVFEHELMRGAQEELVAVARTVASAAATSDDPVVLETLVATVSRATGAEVRVLDANGHVTMDSGIERHRMMTRGRELTEGLVHLPRTLAVTVSDPANAGPVETRREVREALSGRAGLTVRTVPGVRGTRLYVAVPVVRAGRAEVRAVYVARSSYPQLVALYRVRNGLIYAGGFGAIGAVIVSLFLAFTISRPLARLTSAAKRLAAGERGVTVRLDGHDEVAELARAFDGMARELDHRLTYFADFAANVSHEFKTPIASIKGAAELLVDGADDDPVARARFLANIRDDADRLSRLVSRLLELSRLEARRDPLVPIDYRSLVEQSVASRDGVTLHWEARHTFVRGSAESLESVLGNLLDNALRYGTVVTVRVTGEGETLRTTVSDDGPGISPANLPRVWDRFFTTERGDGGTGLGLTIAKVVVETHGGAVGVTSREGEGATFWFTVPRVA